jgi:hypothetical protein
MQSFVRTDKALPPAALLFVLTLLALGLPASGVAASARSWSAPVELAGPAGSVGAPQISLDGSGESVAVWDVGYGVQAFARAPGTRPFVSKATDVVQAAVRPVGGSYGTAQTLSNPDADAYSASDGTDAEGEAIAVWTQAQTDEASFGEKSTIEYALRPAGGSFGPAKLLSAAGAQGEEPSLAVNAAGEAVAVWLGAKGTEIQYATRGPGGTFGAPQTFAPTGSASPDDPHAALDGRGDAIIVWDEGENRARACISGRSRPRSAPARQSLDRRSS